MLVFGNIPGQGHDVRGLSWWAWGHSYTGTMLRTFLAPRLAAVVAAGSLALTGCSQAGLSTADAYRVGCPALDAVAASGSVAGKVALAGLEQLRDSGQLAGESRQFVETAIQYLKDPTQVPEEGRKAIKDGCATNGYTLKNF